MNIQNLEYFLQLAKYEHVSVTAEFLNISQPSLSKHIAALEQELGIKLFDRKGNRIVLNKNGEQFAQYVQQSMDLLHAGINYAKRSVYDTKGTIRIAYTTYAPILTDCIERYTQLNPMTSFQITTMLSSSELPAFDDLDFVLLASHGRKVWDSSDKFWISQHLFQENYVLIYNRTYHPNIPAHALDIATLEQEPFIVRLTSFSSRSISLVQGWLWPLFQNLVSRTHRLLYQPWLMQPWSGIIPPGPSTS